MSRNLDLFLYDDEFPQKEWGELLSLFDAEDRPPHGSHVEEFPYVVDEWVEPPPISWTALKEGILGIDIDLPLPTTDAALLQSLRDLWGLASQRDKELGSRGTERYTHFMYDYGLVHIMELLKERCGGEPRT